MSFNTRSDNLPPLHFDGTQLLYTDNFKYLGMVFDKTINLNVAADAALRPFTAGTFRHVCKPDLGYPLLTTRQRDGQSHTKGVINSAKKNSGGKGHHSLLVHHA